MKKLLLLLLFVPLLSFGQAATYPANFDRFMTLATGASSQTIGFASNGSPVPTTAYAGTGAHVGNLGVFSDAVAGSKGLEVRGGASLPVGNKGVTVPVTAVGKVSAASLGKAFSALAGLAGGPVGLVAAFAIPFTLDWMAAAKVRAGAGNTWEMADPLVCTVAPCKGYTGKNDAGYTTFAKLTDACNSYIGRIVGGGTVGSVAGMTDGANTAFCRLIIPGVYPAPNGLNYEIGRPAIAASPVTYIASSEAQVLSQLATVQPNPYVLSELYNKAVIDNKIDLNIVAAGPATVAGPVSTVNTPATELTPASTTTTSTDYNCTYVMAVTTCNESSTVTKDGVVTQTTAKPAEPAPSCGLPGTPVCAVKVDEVGTPDPYASDKYKKAADDYKAQQDAVRNTVSGSADKPFFTGWALFFTAPALATCSAVILPNGPSGASMGSINPCPVVDGVRYVMGLMWAFGALMLSMKMVKDVV